MLDVSISTNTYISVSVTNGASKRTIRLNKMREKIFAKTFAEVQAKKLLENWIGNLENVKQIAISLVCRSIFKNQC